MEEKPSLNIPFTSGSHVFFIFFFFIFIKHHTRKEHIIKPTIVSSIIKKTYNLSIQPISTLRLISTLNMKNEIMNNHDETSIRPIFRVLYGILCLIGLAVIFLVIYVIYEMWDFNTFEALELNSLFILAFSIIFMLGAGVCFAYTGFIIARSGHPPEYLLRYVNRYKQKENKNV